MKKILAICLMMLLCLSGCQQKTNAPEITGSVSVLYGEQIIVSDDITTTLDNAEKVLLGVCQEHKIPYRLNNHMFDGFGGYDSTDTDGWILYIDGELADKGAYQISLEDGFHVEFRYVNYNEVFFTE